MNITRHVAHRITNRSITIDGPRTRHLGSPSPHRHYPSVRQMDHEAFRTDRANHNSGSITADNLSANQTPIPFTFALLFKMSAAISLSLNSEEFHAGDLPPENWTSENVSSPRV